MRYCVLFALLFVTLPVLAQNATAQQAESREKGTLIKSIVMEGFMLEDKGQFVKLFKAYRNKYLTKTDMDEILQKVQDIYEKEGYQELVSITYQVVKNRLVFAASMIS